jgi:hypothetical protein
VPAAGPQFVSRLPVATALGSAVWEVALITALEACTAVTVVRRCVDVVELLSVAATGQAQVALVSASLRNLDVDAIDRLLAAEVVPVGVLSRGDAVAEQRLTVLGVRHLLPADAEPEVLASVLTTAAAEGTRTSATYAFSDPGAARPPAGPSRFKSQRRGAR